MKNKLIVPTWWNQSTFKNFKVSYEPNKRNTIFFIGSGLSRWKGLPDWKGLLLAIATQLERKHHAEIGLIETINALLNEKNPEHKTIGTILKDITKANKIEWRQVVKDCLSTNNKYLENVDIHKKVAKLNCKGIITTNFDNLIEQGHSSKEEFDVVFPGHPLMQKIEGNRNKKFILKLHGDIENSDSTIILTTEDYQDLYNEGRNGSELSKNLANLRALLRTNTIIFLGFSHDDIYLNRYFTYAMQNRDTDQVFALVPMSGDPKTFKDYLKDKKDLGVQFISYSQDNKYIELYEFLEYLDNPNNIESEYNKKLNIKIPTTIMLYCGGTIGSAKIDKQPLIIKHQQSRYSKELLSLSNRISEWYKLPRDYDYPIDDSVDIIWEILPPEHQLFSENTTPELWNVIADKLSEIFFKYFYTQELLFSEFDDERLIKLYEDDKKQFHIENVGEVFSEEKFLIGIQNRYILGIILLTGTDTLSYTASAVVLKLQKIPCSIVITGANNPPDQRPDLNAIRYINRSLKSDSWKNLLLSLYFLQALGHRLREVFVCFGDTVHIGVNLRKRSTDSIPFRKILKDNSYEPFIYRNVSFHSEYMFKLIDGVFCNNYYPRAEIAWFETYNMREKSPLNHIRYKLKPDPKENALLPFFESHFSSYVKVIQINPIMPSINAKSLGQDNNDITRAILIEGYASGTYPTIESHNFTYLLETAYDENIPIMLISLFGIVPTQSEYERYEIKGKKIKVLTLYGIITETATPLLSLIVSNIPFSQWDSTKNYDDRIELIKYYINTFFRTRTNIVSEELKYVINKDSLLSRIENFEFELNQAYENIHMDRTKSESRLSFSRQMVEDANYCINNPFKNGNKAVSRINEYRTMFILRNDFLFLLEELTTFPLEKIGLSPDGFHVLNNAGYKIGDAFASKECKKESMTWLHGYEYYSDRTEDEKLTAKNNAINLLNDIEYVLKNCGFADIEFIKTVNDQDFLSVGHRYIKFTVKIKKHDKKKVATLKYETVSYLESNAKFYHDLRNGYLMPEECQDEYDKSLKKIWATKVLSIDWFVLGILRGVLARIGILLRINEIAVGVEQSNLDQDLLQESVKLRMIAGDDNALISEIILF